MIRGGSYKDENIISRSFRFISPNVGNPDNVFKYIDYDLETSFFSTAIGDNRYLNPLPGFGFNTDPCPDVIGTNVYKANEFIPMGRYYKRIYDDNATLLTITAGAPEFSGILNFITNAFDYGSSLITNKGRAPSIAFYVAEALSSIAFFPLQLIGVGLNVLSFLFNTPKNQWYYVKPAMGLYLAAAQGIFNDLLTSAGYIAPILKSRDLLPSHSNESYTRRNGGDPTTQGRLNIFYADEENTPGYEAATAYSKVMYKNAVNDDGTIDIGRMITRGVRKYRTFLGALKDLDNVVPEGANSGVSASERANLTRARLEAVGKMPGVRDNGFINEEYTSSEFLKQELATVSSFRGIEEISSPELASAYYDVATQTEIRPSSGQYDYDQGYTTAQSLKKQSDREIAQGISVADDSTSKKIVTSTDAQQQVGKENTTDANQDSWLSTVGNLVKDTFYGGFDAVTFRVEGGAGPTSDSFSNQTQQSEIAGYFNGTVSAVNNFRFNVQGGRTGFAPFDSLIEGITDFFAGAASGTAFGGPLLAALGNAKMVIPEHWADSTTNLHTESFQIKCNALYATSYSIATQIYLPLSLILPFVLPVATGGGTYTSPFMCKVFSQGKTVIKTGIVKNASITFGEGELGWTKDRKPLNMTINLEFADLDPIIAAPVSRIKNPLEVFNGAKVTGAYLGDIGKYDDFVARTTGRDYLDTVLTYNRLNRALTRFTNDFTELFSPTRVTGIFSDSVVSDIANIAFSRPLNR